MRYFKNLRTSRVKIIVVFYCSIFIVLAPGANVLKQYWGKLPWYFNPTFPVLKYCGKLPQHFLPPWVDVIKLFIGVMYCHFVVFIMILMFYNTGWHQYHGMIVNNHGKKFDEIDPRGQFYKNNRVNYCSNFNHTFSRVKTPR